jgi:hypothetical protein
MTPEQWEGYQACINDVKTKRWVDRDGRQVGFLAKPGPNSIGDYGLVSFEDDATKPVGYAVMCAGTTNIIAAQNDLPDGTYLLYAVKYSDNVKAPGDTMALLKMFGEKA